jgi:hypothetical protein
MGEILGFHHRGLGSSQIDDVEAAKGVKALGIRNAVLGPGTSFATEVVGAMLARVPRRPLLQGLAAVAAVAALPVTCHEMTLNHVVCEEFRRSLPPGSEQS